MDNGHFILPAIWSMEGSKFAFFDFGYGATDRPVGVKFCMRLEL